jgi:hypothetical protein
MLADELGVTPPADGVPAGELAASVVNHAGLIEDPEEGLHITAVRGVHGRRDRTGENVHRASRRYR